MPSKTIRRQILGCRTQRSSTHRILLEIPRQDLHFSNEMNYIIYEWSYFIPIVQIETPITTLTEVIIHLIDPTEDNETIWLSLKANDSFGSFINYRISSSNWS